MQNRTQEIRIEIFARECMGLVSDEDYVNWAIEELLLGNESGSISILAGLEKPFNHFEIIDYKEKSKNELGIKVNCPEIVDEYAGLLSKRKLNGKITSRHIANEMIEILKFTEFNSKYKAWLDIDEFFDDYYVISEKNIEDVINQNCKEILKLNNQE